MFCVATFSGVVGPPPSVSSWSYYYYEKAIKGIPTCYIFPSPQDSRSPRPPFHSLVPQGSSREPGLILVSVAGSVRFWDSIGIGLAGGENYFSSELNDMEYDEEVTNLIRADVSLFLSINEQPCLSPDRHKHIFFQHPTEASIASSSPLLVGSITWQHEDLHGPPHPTPFLDFFRHSFPRLLPPPLTIAKTNLGTYMLSFLASKLGAAIEKSGHLPMVIFSNGA